MKEQFIFLLFSTTLLISCDQENKLTGEDYKWMPYKGNETYVFKSNKEDIDTIFLLKKDTMLASPEAQSLNGTKCEIVSVFCKHTDPVSIDGKERYIENYFFEIKKDIDNKAEITILLAAKDAIFYRISSIKIDSLNKIKPFTLQTQYGKYDDVFLFNSEDYLDKFRQRSNFITKVYWSKSNGLVRYDKKDTVYWELAKKL